MKRWLH